MGGEARSRVRMLLCSWGSARCSPPVFPQRGQVGLSHSPLSHGRTQTDRQTPGCPRTLVFSPPHRKGFPRWKLPIPRPSCKAGGWGRGCRRTESDEGLRLACMSGFSPQEDLFPPLHLPSSKPYFTFFLLWNPPPDPPPPTPQIPSSQTSCGIQGLDISLSLALCHDTEKAAPQAPPTRTPPLRII